MEPTAAHRLAQFLALNRTVGVVLLTVLLFGLGEELWARFMPAYLDALHKGAVHEAGRVGEVTGDVLWLVGIYACLLNLFEGVCYISGGHLTARLGDRGSLLLFGGMTITGYVLFLVAPVEWAAVVAAILILGWEPLSVPVTFTTVGSTVSNERRGMAFAVQSIQKRLPKILGPAIAGVVLQSLGRADGMRILVGFSLLLGLVSMAVQFWWMPRRKGSPAGPRWHRMVRDLPPRLRRLLMAEILTRWCDWLVREFVVLYLLIECGVPDATVGYLIATQNITAMLTYLPIGRMTENVGLQPFIGVTFVFFALFPLALALSPADDWLFAVFVVYGLREIGEPARKALITSLMPEAVRARGVGLYWGLRSFAVCTASLVGAAVWAAWGAHTLFLVACGFGCCGAAIFYAFCREPA